MVQKGFMKEFEDSYRYNKLASRLVNDLKDKGITNDRVLEAIYRVPRQFFMPSDLEYMAYEDEAFPIGEGQTISQPYTVAYQTQLLDVQQTDKVLEIGTGSAYQAVILAVLADEVFSIERQRKLFEKNREFKYVAQFTNLYFFYGDGYEGLPEFAPFDKILITAAAPYIPPKLIQQLKAGGILVLPLGKGRPQKMMRITKKESGELDEEFFDSFLFVPMLEGTKD